MRVRRLAGLLILICSFQGVRTYGQVVATWTDSSGNYSNAANWSTNTVPNNSGGTSYAAVINGTGADTIAFDASGTVVNSLTLGNGETFQTSGGPAILSVGSFSNSGTVNWGSASNLIVNGNLLNDGSVPANFNITGLSTLRANSITDGLESLTYNSGTPLATLTFDNSSMVVTGSGVILGLSNLQLLNGSTGTIVGALDADEPSRLVLNNSSLSAGSIDFFGFTTVTNGALVDQGNFRMGDEGQFTLNGSSVTVGGTFSYDGGTISLDKSSLTVRGDYVATSDLSSITLSNGSILTVGGNLMSGRGESLNVAGESSVSIGGDFLNSDASHVGIAGTLTVKGTLTNSGPAPSTVGVGTNATLIAGNYSQLAAQDVGTSTIIAGTLITNSYQQSGPGGGTTIESGGLLKATTFQATGGIVTVNGILDPTAVEIDAGAALQGTGLIVGNLAMGGTIMPGAPGTPGTLTLLGNYEQFGNGTFDEQIGAHSSAFFNITGDAALDFNSLLIITLLNGYDPLGQTFSIMDYNSLVGQFSNGSYFCQDGYCWDVTYGRNQIDITAVSTPEPSSLLLLFVGLAGLAFYTNRKMDKTRLSCLM